MKATVYGNASCPYCGAARMLLTKKAVEFEDINMLDHPERFTEMMEKTGSRTVPQIFLGDTHVGGFDELYVLEQSGELDKMIGG